jgi:hypothetical protein
MEPHNDPLSRILALAQLRLEPESLAALLEHEKWMLQEQHRHEKEMRQMEVRLGTVVAAPGPGPSETNNAADTEFNADTSHGQCGPEHIGLISKTKVAAGAAQRAKETRNPDKLPEPLLALAITISWCGERLGRWPTAKDAKVAFGLRDELQRAVDKYGAVKVMKALDHISGELLVWDPRLVTEQLDTLRTEANRISAQSFSSSPLFAEFHKSHPYIDAETFDTCYNERGGNFVETGKHLLRKRFLTTPPREYEHIEGWEVRCHQYLPPYLPKWLKELKAMETRMRVAQRAWKDSMG